MTVLKLGGAVIDWNNPPAATDKVQWSKKATSGKTVTGSLRTIAHLDRLDALALEKFKTGVSVIQPSYNTGVAASAGTHDYDACLDVYIPGVGWWDQQKFFRANGFACWYRHAPLFGNHIHGFTLPAGDASKFATKVGIYVDGGVTLNGRPTTSSQLVDYHNHAFALAGQHGKNSDSSWFPPNIAATVFDLPGYIKARAWKPNAAVKSTLAVIQRQFQGRDPLKKYNGVGLIQQALNSKIKAGLAVDGIAGPTTRAAWTRYEHTLPASQKSGKESTPDPKSLHALNLARLFVGPEAK